MKYLVLALVFTSLVGYTEAVCNYHGQTYTTGQGFASDDGCNRCNCLASGMATCTKIFCGQKTCQYHGHTHQVGEGFRSVDGCNHCTCTAFGVACTELFCVSIPYERPHDFVDKYLVTVSQLSQTCQYHGHTHQVGEGFRSVDGCNHCTCTAFGVACTEIFCVSTTTAAVGCTENGHFYRNGQSFPSSDGCNTCGCSMGMVTCTAMACI
ncbi:hypothetical protein ScPMuIL_003246 [Solemya velum]